MATGLQKRAFKAYTDNPRNKGKALLEAGYSVRTAEKPKTVIESKGWQELMDKYLPDKLLNLRHKQLLNKKEILLKANKDTGKVEAVKGGIDTNAVKAGLDMAYKLKGKYAPEKRQVSVTGLGALLLEINQSKQSIVNEDARETNTGTKGESKGQKMEDQQSILYKK